jgi:hypothetical protein
MRLVRWILVLVWTGANAGEGERKMKDCPMHQRHMAEQQKLGLGESDGHFAGVTERGDKAMGFAHHSTVHHFGLTRQGGFISAQAKDVADASSRDAIRQHFQHITTAFAAGDFELPMLIHAKSPPGVTTLKRLKGSIRYQFQETDRGGRILISTENPKALRAVHQFLRFQIEDHRTGDSSAISK